MRFDLDGLEVFFPYPSIYPEQYEYMLELKNALDAKGHCMLEMPTGTGKTVSLLSLITSYQYAHPETGKLVYCTRTVPEMSQTIEELKRVINHRNSLLSEEQVAKNPVLGVCLSARRNMCIHPKVMEASDREQVDVLCRRRTAPWVRMKANDEGNTNSSSAALCEFYEEYDRRGSDIPITSGIYNLEDMQQIGRENGWCPYFATRHVVKFASVIVYNYQYMLDPKVANMVSKELEKECIVVFDEAHNIDNVCIEALSVNFNRRSLEAAAANVSKLNRLINTEKEADQARLNAEYQALVEGLTASGAIDATAADVLGNPVLPDDILDEAVPGNIRKAQHFVKLLDIIIKHLKTRMRVQRVEKETPIAFLHNVQSTIGVESKPLRFAYSRLNSLLRTLRIVDLEEFTPICQVADFLTLVATPDYKNGFMIIIEPYDQRTPHFEDPIIQFACLDASLAIKPVLKRFQSVIITSGTLSPIDLYPKLLDLQPKVRRSLSMSIVRPCICPMIVTRGTDQTPVTSQFNARENKAVVRNYGALLIDLAKSIPDGIVCFFTSYQYMENVVTEWHEQGVLAEVLKHKLLFIETKDVVETTLALDNYRRACDCGRGAVFLSVARGKVSEGIDFDRHYGRCVVLYGIPFQYTKSHILLARLEYLRRTFKIREDEFLAFDALRQASQCVGRVIRSKVDYGIMIFADKRYNNQSKRSKLPPWITQFLEESNANLSTEEAVNVCKSFLKNIAQPLSSATISSSVQVSTLLTEEDLTKRAETMREARKARERSEQNSDDENEIAFKKMKKN
mmetsp:Transcript_27360/g.33406  ORF Transcript_27360/g.33406 Transcript_27360/m.33406 type:complete len:795 (-) Transcript_27360:280-2664(-)